ncbi:SNF2 family helicase/ATPase [Penicillium antarcticum]|uniref:SNF2 family helicase/ATPase n=1 Tax=Penicillium antarcticum TaxID=416450 RepID=UPI00239EF839|nr:SNF2 family helicase/ATPase [Penicillium antarcticum]KAJ5317951.1 SNF2 family helicase/ATPase [Penicillium antarcticum]
MATGFTPTYLKDPIDWSVDDVMTFLWPRVPHKWAHSYQPPDIDVLGPIFRARGVNGRVLLHSVTTDLLRVSMGITNMSERIYILHIIRYLRDHSVAFAHPAASGQSLPTGPATPTAGTPLQSTSSKQPKRATNLMTTPLMPNHAGLATDPAFWTPLSRVPATATVSAPPMVFEPNPPVDAFTAELLRRHPPETNDDNALPLYGDSESSDYDANEQREIEDLPEKEPPNWSFARILDQLTWQDLMRLSTISFRKKDRNGLVASQGN